MIISNFPSPAAAAGGGTGGGTGGTFGDGIRILSRDADGMPLTVDISSCGDKVLPYNFYNPGSSFGTWVKMQSVQLSPTTTDIGNGAFNYCGELLMSSLPSGVTSIGSNAFNSCSKLALTSLPAGVTTLGESTFYRCAELALTSLPASLISIGPSAFADCAKITAGALPPLLAAIPMKAFQGCTRLAISSLPSGIQALGNYAFQNCPAITLSSLPSGVMNIPTGSFLGCTQITLTETPPNVREIATSAFQGCTSLGGSSQKFKAITQKLGTYALKNCTNLRKVFVPSACAAITASSPTVGPFSGCSTDCVIYTEVTSALPGWGTYWNYCTTGTPLTVVYGVSEADFDAL